MAAEELKKTATVSSINSHTQKVELVESRDAYGIRSHWKCLAACTLVSLCPFQYGLDFGLIGNLQAMVGFLQVCSLHFVTSWPDMICLVRYTFNVTGISG